MGKVTGGALRMAGGDGAEELRGANARKAT